MDSNEYEYKLRDQFAMAALPAIIKGYEKPSQFSGSIAYHAYTVADAMMDARKK